MDAGLMGQGEHFLLAGFRASSTLAASTFSGRLRVVERCRGMLSWFSNWGAVLRESSPGC